MRDSPNIGNQRAEMGTIYSLVMLIYSGRAFRLNVSTANVRGLSVMIERIGYSGWEQIRLPLILFHLMPLHYPS